MNLDRRESTVSLIDVLDRVLDKGIVIDAWARVSLAGIDLITVEARVVVASIATYSERAAALSHVPAAGAARRAAAEPAGESRGRAGPARPLPALAADRARARPACAARTGDREKPRKDRSSTRGRGRA